MLLPPFFSEQTKITQHKSKAILPIKVDEESTLESALTIDITSAVSGIKNEIIYV